MNLKSLVVLSSLLFSANAWSLGEVFKLLPSGRLYCGYRNWSDIKSNTPPVIFARVDGIPGTSPIGVPISLWADENLINPLGNIEGPMYVVSKNYQVVYGTIKSGGISQGSFFAKLSINNKGRVNSMAGTVLSDSFDSNACFKQYSFKTKRIN